MHDLEVRVTVRPRSASFGVVDLFHRRPRRSLEAVNSPRSRPAAYFS
ncbi:hypothetical protein [Streptomyces varsoviensis]|nr:hypothetical protein [Streptomyces varsoviensis]